MIKRIKHFFLFIVSVLLFAVLAAGIYFCSKGYLLYREATEQTSIADIRAKINAQTQLIGYSELPQTYIDAVIAAEDKRFEDHCGIDVLAILRAAWVDVTTLSFAEGGSTITQQLAKNELFTQEKQIERKFAEIFAAFEIEQTYSKEEIFELYVNSIYFGNGYYGVQEASQGYFNKEASELTDAEAVLLAGLPNAPSIYTPSQSPELAVRRATVVLRRMVDCGSLSQDEADRIQADVENMFEPLPATAS